MNTLGPSFLIVSSSFLQVTRTCMKVWMSLNFSKFATELRPLIDVRIEFLYYCIHIIIDKIYVGIVNHCFHKFATVLRPLIDIRIWFLLNILSTNRQIGTKFCIHIIIDKIYVGIVNLCFSQICNRVMAFD